MSSIVHDYIDDHAPQTSGKLEAEIDQIVDTDPAGRALKPDMATRCHTIVPRLALILTVVAACDAAPPRSPPPPLPVPVDAVQHVAPVVPASSEVMATLERQGCYGWCPIYKITIHRDGRVEYHGEEFVKVRGDAAGHLTPAQLADLDRAFDKAGYFSLADKYTEYDVTDNPTAITSYARDGLTKTITHYFGDEKAPKGLYDLETTIDTIVGTDRWIGTEAEREQHARDWH
ncbi:MAG TPA: DUF6438 domain-containing protein [Kofleriaceae bacterium]